MSSNKLLLKFALRYPVLVFLTILLSFSGALFNGIGTALLVPLFLGLSGQENVALKSGPAIIQKLMSPFEGVSGMQQLLIMTGAVLIMIILKNLSSFFGILVGGYLSRSLVNNIRLEGIQLMLEVDLDFYAKNKIGDIVSRISQEVNRTAGAIKIAIQMVTNVVTIFVFIAVLISLSWQLTLLTTVLLFSVALSNQYFIKQAKNYGKVLSQKAKDYTNKLLEILNGIRLIKTVGNEDQEYQKISTLVKERETAQMQSQVNYAVIAPINEILGILAILFIALTGRFLFSDPGNSSDLNLPLYLIFLFRLLPLIGQLNGSRSRFSNAAPSSAIIADFLQRDNKPLMINGSNVYQEMKQGLRFENVDFAYPNCDDLVLQKINLEIPKGKTTALVGTSGAGKSTLVDLLPRFYDPIAGNIILDGIELKDYDIKSIRRKMGVVSQDTFLFNNSVRYNIAYGLENATEEDIIEATKRANAYEFISKLSDGLETEIGDRGVMLSGGQRQRLAIARALLRNPDILILDEATSALDTVSERLVQGAIDELCRDRTTVVIAHRLSTIQQAHQIVVMEKGEIMEVGNHEELLQKQDGHYSKLYSMQFSKKVKPKVVLPTNAALIRASLRASHELRTRLSYEVRTRLSSMLGSLRLMADGLVDTPEEQQELIEESYDAALRLLKTIQYFEEKAPKSSIKLD